MRLARKVPAPAVSAQDQADHADALGRIDSLKREIAAAERRAKAEALRPIERKRLIDPLKADLRDAEARADRLRGLLIEQDRAVASLQRRKLR